MENYNVTKETLLRVDLPLETSSYKPVSYNELIDLTLGGVEKAGFKVDNEKYISADRGLIATGKYTISDVADSEMQLQIGWLNSYNKVRSLKWSIGVNVFVCTNNCVRGDFGGFRKKHTGKIQTFTPTAISEYIKKSSDTFRLIQDEREKMKEIEVTKRISAEIIGRMFIEESLITSTQLNIINREISSPSFDYKSKDSLWELYNHVTFSMRQAHPNNWMDSHINAHNFFVNECSLLSGTPRILHPELKIVEESMFKQLELFAVN